MANLSKPVDLDNYQLWQLENKGNILPSSGYTPEGELYESGIEEINRLSEWIERQTEAQQRRDAA